MSCVRVTLSRHWHGVTVTVPVTVTGNRHGVTVTVPVTVTVTVTRTRPGGVTVVSLRPESLSHGLSHIRLACGTIQVASGSQPGPQPPGPAGVRPQCISDSVAGASRLTGRLSNIKMMGRLRLRLTVTFTR